MSGQEIPEAFQELIAEPGWRSNDDGDLWLWEIKTGDGDPGIRVALEDGEWWVTWETDGYTILDLDTALALLICMVRVHDALKTPLSHIATSLSQLAAIAREDDDAQSA